MQFLLDAIPLFDATLRLSTPLILCAMAGLISERAGVIDIGLEGKMLAAAFASAATASLTGSPWAGLGAAMLVGWALAMVHGFACITHKGEQIVSGVAINILAAGLTIVVGIALFNQGGQTPLLGGGERFQALSLPLAETLRAVPVIGPIYAELISGHSFPVYLALATVLSTWALLYRTTFGLRLRAVGEMPAAVDNAGISVIALRYRAVMLAGLLCGIAGAYLSTAHGAGFVRDMSAGKGFIALAAMIFGKWRPGPVLFACLLFGFLEASAARLHGVELPLIGAAPVELILILPYLATVVLLAGFFGKAIPPAALGTPYVKER